MIVQLCSLEPDDRITVTCDLVVSFGKANKGPNVMQKDLGLAYHMCSRLVGARSQD
jgi:hypothetical protein